MYLKSLTPILQDIEMQARVIAPIIEKAIKSGNTIWIMGNGGSASTANHLETDLTFIRLEEISFPIRVFSLSANSSLITAIANDISFDEIYSKQLMRRAMAGDVAVLISASGESPNIRRALEFCRTAGVISIGLTGFDGGIVKRDCDYSMHFPTDNGMYGPVEDAHLALCHVLTSELKMRLLL